MLRRALLITGRVMAVDLCLLSLPVCAAAAYLWVRGYFTVDVIDSTRRRSASGVVTHTVHRLSSGRGVVVVSSARNTINYSQPPGRPGLRLPDYDTRHRSHVRLRPDQFRLVRQTWWQKLGFHADRHAAVTAGYGQTMKSVRSWRFRVPYWLIVVVTGVVPAWYFRRLGVVRQRFRASRGLCGRCGYDLRASRERCPECGKRMTTHAAGATVGDGGSRMKGVLA